VNAADMAKRIIAGIDRKGDTGALALLEHLFGRADDAAIAYAVAFWGLSTINGEAPDAEVAVVGSAILLQLESEVA
jgi:hypothetical protein